MHMTTELYQGKGKKNPNKPWPIYTTKNPQF